MTEGEILKRCVKLDTRTAKKIAEEMGYTREYFETYYKKSQIPETWKSKLKSVGIDISNATLPIEENKKDGIKKVNVHWVNFVPAALRHEYIKSLTMNKPINLAKSPVPLPLVNPEDHCVFELSDNSMRRGDKNIPAMKTGTCAICSKIPLAVSLEDYVNKAVLLVTKTGIACFKLTESDKNHIKGEATTPGYPDYNIPSKEVLEIYEVIGMTTMF